MNHRGYQFSGIVLVYFLALYFNVINARTTYTVGDANGWSLSSNFSNWVQGKEFNIGDVLEFKYEKGMHNVMQVNSTEYEECTILDEYLGPFTSGNDSIVLSKVGKMWFICGVGDHCQKGQKLAINVLP